MHAPNSMNHAHDLADLLSQHNNDQSVSQKFSQSQKPGTSQIPTTSLLDRHNAAYGGTASQIAPSQAVA